MASRDEIIQAIRNADAAGDSASVRKLGAYLQTMQPDAPAAAPEKSFATSAGESLRDAAAGAVRGAGSIGATILYPIDKATDLIKGDRTASLSDLVTGKKPLSRNEERRRDMDLALQDLGADTTSISFKGGKLAGEVAGTAGTGGLIANGLRAIPGVAAAAPGFVNAVRTAGMSAGPSTGVANLATRAAGGALTGGASAGLVNPEDAGAGAIIGGALPGVAQVAGKVGQKIGAVIRGPEQSPELAAAVTKARDAGYVLPPSQANPSLMNRALEGFAGKVSTAQNASAKNQTVTNKLAAETLGLAPDVKITPDVLKSVRDQAGQAYDVVSNAGTITPTQTYADALDKIAAPYVKASQGFPNAKASPVIDLVESLRSPSFDSGAAIAKIKELRTAADDAFRSGNTDVARASKAAAGALEDAVEGHLQQVGAPDALQNFRDARQLIAKTYSVEKALNPTSGSVDARKLAQQLSKGKPLSGGIKDAAEFAAQFPKAAQSVEAMGSLPQTSPLDWAAGSGISAATGNPLMLAGVLARPGARKLTMSNLVQNRLVQAAPGQPSARLTDLLQGGYRAAPLIASGP